MHVYTRVAVKNYNNILSQVLIQLDPGTEIPVEIEQRGRGGGVGLRMQVLVQLLFGGFCDITAAYLRVGGVASHGIDDHISQSHYLLSR